MSSFLGSVPPLHHQLLATGVAAVPATVAAVTAVVARVEVEMGEGVGTAMRGRGGKGREVVAKVMKEEGT